MHARVMHVTMKPERLDEAVARWPSATGLFRDHGLIHGYMIVLDRAAGRVLSVTVWDSEASIRAQEASEDFAEVMAPFHDYFAAEPVSEYGEVAANV